MKFGNGARPAQILSSWFTRTNLVQKEVGTSELEGHLKAVAREVEPAIHWIACKGIDRQALELLRAAYDLPEKAIEDCMETNQPPNVDGFGSSNLFFIFRMQGLAPGTESTKDEQISVFFLSQYKTVITVQESDILWECWEKIEDKLGNPHSLIRSGFDASFMLYAFTDAVVDFSFPILENFTTRLHELTADMMEHTPVKEHLQITADIRAQLISLRMNLWRTRELLTELMQDEYNSLSQTTKTYMRDVYTHTENNVQVLEAGLAQCQEINELYGSYQSAKLNDTLNMLTVVSMFILPPQFLCAIYGMNFEYMPELKWEWSYFVFWCVIIIMAVVTYVLLYKDTWQKQRRSQTLEKALATMQGEVQERSLAG